MFSNRFCSVFFFFILRFEIFYFSEHHPHPKSSMYFDTCTWYKQASKQAHRRKISVAIIVTWTSPFSQTTNFYTLVHSSGASQSFLSCYFFFEFVFLFLPCICTRKFVVCVKCSLSKNVDAGCYFVRMIQIFIHKFNFRWCG